MGSGKNLRARSCHSAWLKKWPFLHYELSKDSLFCYPCYTIYHQKKLLSTKTEKAFISGDGFSDWKKAAGETEKNLGKIAKHAKSECHKEAMSKFDEISAAKNIAGVLSKEYIEEQEQNKRCLIIILDFVRTFGRQGLPLRGTLNRFESDFHQFLLVESRKNPDFDKWMKKKTNKYTSIDMTNEMLEIMALEILSEVVDMIKNANFFSICADETCDASNTEQLSFYVRWIGENFKKNESFIGLHELKNTSSDHLVYVIKNILLACNFDFNKICGQCYDKAASMSGEKTGVKTQILIENPKALWIHCLNHGLNLAVLDTVNQIKLFKNCISYSEEILILFCKSAKRAAMLKELKLEDFDFTPGVKKFARTRWTSKGQTANYFQ